MDHRRDTSAQEDRPDVDERGVRLGGLDGKFKQGYVGAHLLKHTGCAISLPTLAQRLTRIRIHPDQISIT